MRGILAEGGPKNRDFFGPKKVEITESLFAPHISQCSMEHIQKYICHNPGCDFEQQMVTTVSLRVNICMYFPRKVNPPAVYMYVFMTVPATVKEPYMVARGLKVRLQNS